MHNGTYRADIDGLRGIAILLVIVFHAFPSVLPAGFIGVDIFFVISGYLITKLLLQAQNQRFSLLEFYRKRILRLVPALITVLIFTLIIGWLDLFPNEFLELNHQIAAGSAFVMNWLLFSQIDYFDSAIQAKPLMHLWSLGIEEQFYILWPLTLLLLCRLKSNNMRLLGTLALTLVSLIYYYWLSHNNSKAGFYLPLSRFWELTIGAALAIGNVRFDKSYLSNLLALICLVLALVVPAKHITAIQLLACAAASLVIASAGNSPLNRIILSNRLLVGTGLISYSLYLWHWPLISFDHIRNGYQQTDFINGVILCVQTLLGALLTYYFIENPLRRSKVKYLPAALCVVLIAIAVGSWSHYQWHWIKPRSQEFVDKGDGYSKYFVKIRRDLHYIPDLLNQRNNLIRSGMCPYRNLSLEEELNYDHASDPCLQTAAQQRNVIVFGDSYADDIYASLKLAYPDINFIQLTDCSFHINRLEDCQPRIDYLLQLLDNGVEDVVIANYWRDTYPRTSSLLEQLQGKAKRIIVFGSGPEFTYPAYLVAGDRLGGVSTTDTIKQFLDSNAVANAIAARHYFEQQPVLYIDRLSIFCTQTTGNPTVPHCVLVNDNGEPYLWDFGHLLPAGMQKVATYVKTHQLF